MVCERDLDGEESDSVLEGVKPDQNLEGKMLDQSLQRLLWARG